MTVAELIATLSEMPKSAEIVLSVIGFKKEVLQVRHEPETKKVVLIPVAPERAELRTISIATISADVLLSLVGSDKDDDKPPAKRKGKGLRG